MQVFFQEYIPRDPELIHPTMILSGPGILAVKWRVLIIRHPVEFPAVQLFNMSVDVKVWMNEGKFRDNGGCGYTLRPKVSMSRCNEVVIQSLEAMRASYCGERLLFDPSFVKAPVPTSKVRLLSIEVMLPCCFFMQIDFKGDLRSTTSQGSGWTCF